MVEEFVREYVDSEVQRPKELVVDDALVDFSLTTSPTSEYAPLGVVSYAPFYVSSGWGRKQSDSRIREAESMGVTPFDVVSAAKHGERTTKDGVRVVGPSSEHLTGRLASGITKMLGTKLRRTKFDVVTSVESSKSLASDVGRAVAEGLGLPFIPSGLLKPGPNSVKLPELDAAMLDREYEGRPKDREKVEKMWEKVVEKWEDVLTDPDSQSTVSLSRDMPSSLRRYVSGFLTVGDELTSAGHAGKKRVLVVDDNVDQGRSRTRSEHSKTRVSKSLVWLG